MTLLSIKTKSLLGKETYNHHSDFLPKKRYNQYSNAIYTSNHSFHPTNSESKILYTSPLKSRKQISFHNPSLSDLNSRHRQGKNKCNNCSPVNPLSERNYFKNHLPPNRTFSEPKILYHQANSESKAPLKTRRNSSSFHNPTLSNSNSHSHHPGFPHINTFSHFSPSESINGTSNLEKYPQTTSKKATSTPSNDLLYISQRLESLFPFRKDDFQSLTDKIEKGLRLWHIPTYLKRQTSLLEIRKKAIKKRTIPTLNSKQLEFLNEKCNNRETLDKILIEGHDSELCGRDFRILRDNGWLNDEIINFYMGLLQTRNDNPELSFLNGVRIIPNCYFFKSFFYPLLSRNGYSKVRRWTRKVDLFSFDKIFFPIHLGNHWTLAVVDFSTKCLEYFDSLGGTNNYCLDILRKYLNEEHLEKKKIPFDDSKWTSHQRKDIPRQLNGYDCGVFMCKFADFLGSNTELSGFCEKEMPNIRKVMAYEILTNSFLFL